MHQAAMNDTFASLEAKNTQLVTALERMQEFDRLKSNFLATVSHELRTPLTSVIGYSEMLLEGLAGPLNEEQKDYVQTVLAKADQLLQLITGILDASLMETGSLRVAREPVELRALIEAVVATFAPQAEKRGIAIALPQADVPRALGDGRKIRQIFWNLIANAVKFTGDGGEVAVDWRVGPLVPDESGGRFPASAGRFDAARHLGVRVSVRDSGIGISAEKQKHIFEPFFQVDSSSTREYGGTGLGLTLAKQYVEAHGGHIWVDSELGAGSVFSVSLPVVPKELDAYLAEHRALEGQ
jgi:signal transduction histidine kinase